MSVEYYSSFGIGAEVIYDQEGFEELEDLILKSQYEIEKIGDRYCGIDLKILITLKDPFTKNYDLTQEIKELKEFLNKNNIEFEKIGLVGGLVVC